MHIPNTLVPIQDRNLRRLLYMQKLAQTVFVEADNEIVVYGDDRYAHLTAFLYHFLTLGQIGSDIVIGEGYMVCGKEVLCRVAEVTGRCRINSYGGCCHGYLFNC